MLMVQGQLLDNGSTGRTIFLVTGTCWSPKVFEVVKCRFEDEAHASAHPLPTPFRCCLETRRNKVAGRFECLQHLTSDELVLDLVQRFADMDIFKLVHTVANLDGTLLWSEVSATERCGRLWRGGMKKPLGEHRVAADSVALVGRLMSDDPFATGQSHSSRGPRAKRGVQPSASTRAPKRSRGSTEGETAHAIGDVDDAGDTTGGAAVGEGPPLPMPRLDDEMDLADAELQSLAGSDTEELTLTYLLAGADAEDPAATDHGQQGTHASMNIEPSAEQLAAMETAMDETGIEGASSGDVPGADGGPDVGVAAAQPADEVVAPPPPWATLVHPTGPSGYYYQNGRSVLRIQRGKPAGRVTISCYRHPACTILVNESRAPPDEEVFEWLYSVPPATAEMSPAERKALSAQHRGIAREKWTAPRR